MTAIIQGSGMPPMTQGFWEVVVIATGIVTSIGAVGLTIMGAKAYTTGAAFAEFAEKQKGKLEPGMLADFVVLDRDITAVASAKILETKVLRTVVGGKTVYSIESLNH